MLLPNEGGKSLRQENIVFAWRGPTEMTHIPGHVAIDTSVRSVRVRSATKLYMASAWFQRPKD